MKRLSILLMAIVATVSAADVAGTWKSSVETPNGTFESTYVFKVDGEKLSGSVSSQMGEAAISEGQIKGDDISFVVAQNFNGNDFKLIYKGKVSGAEIKLTIEIPGRDRTFELTAKRVP